MVEQLGKYLEDQGVVSINSTLFFYSQPDVEDVITSIYPETVPQPDYVQGFNSDHIGAKFLTRGSNSKDAKDLAWNIHKKITQLGDIELTAYNETIYFVSVNIVNPPTYLETDNKGRATFVSHYSVHIETTGNAFRQSTITTT